MGTTPNTTKTSNVGESLGLLPRSICMQLRNCCTTVLNPTLRRSVIRIHLDTHGASWIVISWFGASSR